MIIDCKVDYRQRRLLLIHDDGEVEERETINPYFYVLVPKEKEKVLKTIIGGGEMWLEEDNRTAIVKVGDRYAPEPNYKVYKVYSTTPTEVPRLSENLRSLGFRTAAGNVKYIVRNCFDLDVRFFDVIPLYYGFDEHMVEKVRKVEGLLVDVEAVKGKPVLASVYKYQPFKEVRGDDVETLELPSELDRLRRLIANHPLIIGHNILGFDIPALEREGVTINRLVKSFFDTSAFLATYGSSLKVGSARSLLDVAMMLKEDAGITDEEVEVKKRVRGRVERLSKEELVKYNVNDVVLTAKLLNIFFPFAAIMSGLTQIPLSEVVQLPSGMVGEYYLLRFIELLGFVPEYAPSSVKLEGERAWLRSERADFKDVVHMDIKMMYPSWVLAHAIDPTLHCGDLKFDRRSGLGVVYSAVERLKAVRETTKSLKKRDKAFESADAGVKAILNALAYGVQGKQSGLAIMGNPWCPKRIFEGTRDVQFKAIEYLQSKGYKVVYSDTDSFFVERGGGSVEEIVSTANEFFREYGLEVDLEGVWDYMFIYGKKNYVLRKGDKVLVKGSALLNLERMYTPSAVKLSELLKLPSKDDRERYVKEVIDSAPLDELFTWSHQQVWRLIGKDVQSWKRLRQARSRYIKVLTPWPEKGYIILKKVRGGQLYLPHSVPLFTLFIQYGSELRVDELNPFMIVEARSVRLEGELAKLKGVGVDADLLIYIDKVYGVKMEGLWYGLRVGSKVKYIPSHYEGVYPDKPLGVLEELKAKLSIREVRVDEETFRRLMLSKTLKTLNDYGLL